MMPEKKKKLKKKFNWKLLLLLAGEFIVAFVIYQVFLAFEVIAIMWVYMIIACGLFVAYVIINRDISMDIPKEEQLPEEWSITQKLDFIAEVTEHRKRAKIILIILVPFVLTFLLDIITLFYLDNLKTLFSNLF